MAEIIRPKFNRKLRQIKRLLRSNPALKNHPEFQKIREPMLAPIAVIATCGVFIMALFKRR